MKRYTLITLFFVTTLAFFSSCKSDDGDTEVRKGFLTAHIWACERMSVNGGPNQVAQLPNELHTFHTNGTYTRVTFEEDGSRSEMNGRWELKDKGRALRIFTDFFETTSSIRELNDNSLKITRQDPDLIVEFDFVPVGK